MKKMLSFQVDKARIARIYAVYLHHSDGMIRVQGQKKECA